jgi:class 3 adenylate cyclase
MAVPHVVISYARKEMGITPILKELEEHCKGLEKSGKITYFIDTRTETGAAWESKILGEFGRAQAAILLIGPSFLASDFIQEVELPLLWHRYDLKKVSLFPLLVKDCDYEGIPRLKEIQFAHEVKKPLAGLRNTARNTIFKKLLKDICEQGAEILDSAALIRAGKSQGTKQHVYAAAGFLIAAEIVNFADNARDWQEKAIRHLWRFTKEYSLTKGQSTKFCIEHGLGDGILLAFPGFSRKVTHKSIIRCAKKLIDIMEKDGVALRVGVHQAPFSARQFKRRRGFEVYGNGRRVCERLAAIGDRGNIVVAETFLESWADHVADDKDRKAFWPREGPIEVFSRRRREVIRVRVSGDPKGLPPSRLALLAVIREKIMDCLEGINEAFWAGLKALNPIYDDPNRLSTRVTIWMRDQNDHWLTCSDLRYHHQRIPHLIGKSNTKHWHSPSRGPIGSAFANNEICVSNGHPDPKTNYEAYIARIVKEWGVEEYEVRSFNRHARAYIGVPICFEPLQPELSICIDVEDPLDQVSVGQLQELCKDIRVKTEPVLAALWMLRLKA